MEGLGLDQPAVEGGLQPVEQLPCPRRRAAGIVDPGPRNRRVSSSSKTERSPGLTARFPPRSRGTRPSLPPRPRSFLSRTTSGLGAMFLNSPHLGAELLAARWTAAPRGSRSFGVRGLDNLGHPNLDS
jgi:hypothetical protein